ncbi:Uncharacterised protein [Burkholderia pseudomallei]|nr:Uncharacterised protein [Burkholderia pseudomallei]
MKTKYRFKRLDGNRFQAIHPHTGSVVGIVFGASNDWKAERSNGDVIANAYATKQDAACALQSALGWA